MLQPKQLQLLFLLMLLSYRRDLCPSYTTCQYQISKWKRGALSIWKIKLITIRLTIVATYPIPTIILAFVKLSMGLREALSICKIKLIIIRITVVATYTIPTIILAYVKLSQGRMPFLYHLSVLNIKIIERSFIHT